MKTRRGFGAVAMCVSAVALAGCAQTPLGPTVQVMPGRGKTFEAFQYDAAACQQYSAQAVAGQADAANNRAVGAAVLGTVLAACRSEVASVFACLGQSCVAGWR